MPITSPLGAQLDCREFKCYAQGRDFRSKKCTQGLSNLPVSFNSATLKPSGSTAKVLATVCLASVSSTRPHIRRHLSISSCLIGRKIHSGFLSTGPSCSDIFMRFLVRPWVWLYTVVVASPASGSRLRVELFCNILELAFGHLWDRLRRREMILYCCGRVR